MARVKRAVHAKKHHRAVLEQAKGYYGNKSRSFRAANEQVMHSMQYAYRDRRARKGDFRSCGSSGSTPAARLHGTSYSRFIAGLHRADVEVDRKVLADLAVTEPEAFAALVQRGQRGAGHRAGGCRSRVLSQIGWPTPTSGSAGSDSSSASGAFGAPRPRWSSRDRTALGGPGRRSGGRVGLRGSRGPGQSGSGFGGRPVLRRGDPGLRSVARGGRAGGRHGHTPAGPGRGAASHRRPPTVARDLSMVMVLVDVRDPGNAGTMIRTADAAGVGAVIRCDGSVDPSNPKTVRASAGSIFHVPVVSGGPGR